MEQTMATDKTILVVDDEVCIVELLELLLEDSYKVVTCNISTQALRKAQEAQPNLVILDLMMPGANGAQILEQLRNDPTLHNIPVILMSANSRFSDQLVNTAGNKENKVSLITKPFDNFKLLDLVENLVQF